MNVCASGKEGFCSCFGVADNGSWRWVICFEGNLIEGDDGFSDQKACERDLVEFIAVMGSKLEARGYGGESAPCRPQLRH